MKYLIALLIVMFFVFEAIGQDTAHFIEPSTNADGSALDDLDSCRITVVDPVSGTTASQPFPASSPAGGATQNFRVTSILGARPTGPSTEASGTCVDVHGNVSVVSNVFQSSFVAPGAPEIRGGVAP